MLTALFCTWLALSPGGEKLFIAREEPPALIEFDTRAHAIAKTTPLDAAPTGLAVAGDQIYATAPDFVHLPMTKPPFRWLLGGRGARGPVASPDTGRIFIANRFEGTIGILDRRSGNRDTSPPVGREPYASALTPDGRFLFVACHLPAQGALEDYIAAQVAVVDAATGAISATIPLPNGTTGVRGIAVSPDGRWAFVTHILARYTVHTTQLEQGWMNTNAVSVIDVAARRLHATFLLDDVDDGAANPWAVAVSKDSHTLFVTTAGTHELHVIDLPALLEKLAGCEGQPADQLSFLIGIRRRLKLPGLGPRALAVHGDTVWVAEHFSNTVAAVTWPGWNGNGTALPAEGDRRLAIRGYEIGPRRDASPEGRGEMLFHDAGLCFQHWQSCSSCHPDARADGLNWDLINDGIGNPKNTKSLVNSHLFPPVMWTGVRPSAEYAVRSGLRHIQFTEPREEEATAIEAYLKSLRPAPGPVRDEAPVERGRKLFFSDAVGCAACHPAPLYTDNRLHNVGTHGQFDFTVDAEGNRVPQTEFKTPSLLEAWRTAPYLHDGRYRTIREVITGGNRGDRRGHTSHLTPSQVDDLTAFVESL